MPKEHSILLPAGGLQKALTTIFRRRRKMSGSHPVIITYDQAQKHLSLEDARYGLCEHNLPAEGTWPEQVEVDGVLLKRICKKFGPTDVIELIPSHDELCLLAKNARITLKRLDHQNKPGI